MERKLTLLFSLALVLSSPLLTHAQDTRLTDGSRITGNTVEYTLASSSNDSVRGQLIAQAHRSTVTSSVRALLDIADRKDTDSVLATEMHRIADIQKTSEPVTTDAIETTASRGTLKTFFFGGNTASINVLRTEMIKTRDILNQLEIVNAHTINSVDAATIAAHIHSLEKDQTDIQDFVTAHEHTAGFFAWFGGLF